MPSMRSELAQGLQSRGDRSSSPIGRATLFLALRCMAQSDHHRGLLPACGCNSEKMMPSRIRFGHGWRQANLIPR